jgi:hypothetical protein
MGAVLDMIRRRDRHLYLFTLPLAAICSLFISGALHSLSRHDLIGNGDWFGLWSVPVIARSSGPVLIYDMARLHSAQVVLGSKPDSLLPFPYPPTFLAILWPLGSLSIAAAFAAFMAASFVVYLVASTDSRYTLPFAALNPAVILNFLAGQSGFLSGGLMLGATRLLTRHPVTAGALFGLLTYKPHLGIMVPVALLAARQWVCVISAAVTTAVTVVATSWWFGVATWAACWQSLGDYAHAFDAATHSNTISPTVSAMLRSIGFSNGYATGAQVAAATVSAIAVWTSWRRLDPRHPQPAIVALCAATFLSTPHALFYDATMLSGSLVLYANHNRTSLRSWERVLILAWIALSAYPYAANIAPLVLAAILWMACVTPRRRPSPSMGP